MKLLKATVFIEPVDIELELEDNDYLTKEEIENLLFDELMDDLPGEDIDFNYTIKEVKNERKKIHNKRGS